MRWTIGNVYVQVHDQTDAERSWLGEYLSYLDESYVPGRRRTHEERRVRLYNVITDEFPAGFARQTYVEAKARGFQVAVQDTRVVPAKPNHNADLSWLRSHPAVVGKEILHQVEAVRAVMARNRGILWIPTGGGKTEVAIGVSKAIPCRWLFLVHRGDLLWQTAERYTKRTGLPAGVIGDGKVEVPKGCKFVVATFQTMHAAIRNDRREVLDVLENAGGLIVDECHAVSAETFFAVAMMAKSAYYRVGMSGTPLARSDGANLMVVGALGPVIYRILPDTLVKLGLLALPRIRMIEVVQTSDHDTWNGVYRECIVKSKKRNDVVLNTIRRAARPCLVFVQQLEHGKHLANMLHREGIPSEFVSGQASTSARQAAIQRLVRSDIEVLVVNVIFQEGVDIPSLKSVVVATGGASVIAALQRIGRGMRADAETGKTTFEVYDLFDRGCGCTSERSVIHDGCKWLERHSYGRVQAYQNEGFSVEHEKEQGVLDFDSATTILTTA